MAKDLYQGRKMYQGPWLYIIIIPIGMFLCFWLFDVFYGMYVENKLKSDTQEILTAMMSDEYLVELEDYKLSAKKLYTELGYDTKDLSVSFGEDYILLINYKSYMNMIGTISFGIFHNKNDLAAARYKGYYNEYKEIVIEEYIEENLDEDIEEESGNDIIIVQ